MPSKKVNTAPRASSSASRAGTVEELCLTTISFGNRSDDWLALGDWLAAGEKLKAHPPKPKPLSP
jgi:alpha-galactosidase